MHDWCYPTHLAHMDFHREMVISVHKYSLPAFLLLSLALRSSTHSHRPVINRSVVLRENVGQIAATRRHLSMVYQNKSGATDRLQWLSEAGDIRWFGNRHVMMQLAPICSCEMLIALPTACRHGVAAAVTTGASHRHTNAISPGYHLFTKI